MMAHDEILARAWQAYHSGDLSAAGADCERLIQADGDRVAALFLASLIDCQRGAAADAAARLKRVVRLRPDYLEARNNLGNVLASQRDFAQAESIFREVLRRQPEYTEAWNNLANVMRDQGRLDEAIGAYARALELRPGYAECHNNLGIALARKRDFSGAMRSYRRAIELSPAFAEPHNNLGIALASSQQIAEALNEFRRALDLKPDYTDALANLALTLADSGRFEEAIANYRRAVELSVERSVKLSPSSGRMQNGLGIVLAKSGDLESAATAFRRAIEADPDHAEGHNNLGNALRELGELDAAETHLRRALAIRPDYPDAHNNLGVVMVKRRQLAEAVACYEQALRYKPDHAEAHLNRALAWLAAGDFRRGWVEYEWRWKTRRHHELQCDRPRWDGGLLDGKTVLLWAEQGLGDTLQFVRYAELVAGRGGNVMLRAPRTLLPILSRTPGIRRLVSDDEPPPRFDCHAPLASLPRLFATSLDDVPRTEPYIFPDERLVADWGGKIAEKSTAAFKIGIAWQGNQRFAADRHRSAPLSCLLPLAGVGSVQLISLQKGDGLEQLRSLADPHAVLALGDLDESAGAFMDTAAIMTHLDLVITSDTALAHLAGAMGIPVGVLLAHAADWRWLTDVEASPWYGTMRLFRQPSPGDWQSPVAKVEQCVRRLIKKQVPGQAIDCYPAVARGWLDRGVRLADEGKLDDAIAAFQRALRFQPVLPEAHNNLGNALRNQGRLDDAARHLERALALSPRYAEAHHNLGIVRARERSHDQAIECFRQAVEIKPDFTLAWTSLGLSQADLRRYGDAEASFRRALALEPNNSRVLNNLGNVLSDQGRRSEAVAVLRRALECDARCVDAYNNLGNALRELGERDEAIASFQRALDIRPAFPEAHNNMGIAWAGKGDYPRAIACYEEALRIWPDYPAAHNNLGIALGHQKRFDEAIASYRRALELSPNYAEAYNNLGIALSQEGDYDEALASFQRALELKPDYAEAYSNMGITLTELGRLEQALESYNEALRLKEEYPDARMNRALAFLVRGDFERGWMEYESRWRCKDFNPRNFKKPQWNGEPLDGRRILLHAEQGFGDSFQFVRYARLVKEQRGGYVIVWCPRPLVPLIRECPYVDDVTIEGEPLPEFDCHLPLLSLPKIFGTTLDTVPAAAPYLFARPDLIAKWREEFSYINALKIGINWQGNPRYRGDRHRSIPLRQFASLAKISGVRLISLQKGHGSEQVDQESARMSVTVLGAHRDEQAGAFMDTAAILMNLDLVISSDTSLVHLAGGLGVPVWVALPWAADWRWLLRRDDCPWYPTMRLVRQSEPGNWEQVFDRIELDVRELARRWKISGNAAPPADTSARLSA